MHEIRPYLGRKSGITKRLIREQYCDDVLGWIFDGKPEPTVSQYNVVSRGFVKMNRQGSDNGN